MSAPARVDPPGRGAKKVMSFRYKLFRGLLRAISRVLFGLTIHGAEKVPHTGPVILAANHRRYADPVLVCMAVPRRIQWMGKKELFTPPFDRFFYFIGTFPVDRKGGGRAALRSALAYLKDGWTLGIFPEGTRRKAYDPNDPPKGGVAMLAARSGAPVVPVFVDRVPNLRERLRGAKLHAYVGDPITIDNTKSGRGSYEEFSTQVLRKVYGLGDASRGGGASSAVCRWSRSWVPRTWGRARW